MTADSLGQNKTLKVLQFTDTHFFKDPSHKLLGVETSSSFAEVYKAANLSHGTPDFYLFTGDMSQDETEESYRRLAEAMHAADAPCYFLPGNHDRRQEMERGLIFPKSHFKIDRQVIKGNWQIILLDSLIEGEVGGHLDSNELKFLQNCLESHSELHALVCLHHHPVPMGAQWLDQIGVDNGKEFMNLISEFEQVKGVLWGHVHQEFNAMHNGVTLMATPSTCVQFKARSNDFGVDAVPPGFRWLELDPDGTIRTAVRRTDKVALGLELSSAGY
jgi:Icc protein